MADHSMPSEDGRDALSPLVLDALQTTAVAARANMGGCLTNLGIHHDGLGSLAKGSAIGKRKS
jgi:hypothetical protein